MKKGLVIFLLLLANSCRLAVCQTWKHFSQGKGLSFSNQIPVAWPGHANEIWPGIGIPFPLVQHRNDSVFSFFQQETGLNPYSNPLIGAYPSGSKTLLFHGYLPAYQMGIFGQCNGGILVKDAAGFSLKNSLNTPALASVTEKFWYNSTKAHKDSSVWIAADTGFRRIHLGTYQTRILKNDAYKGIALYNRMSANGNQWAGFRNDYGVWCFLWGDTNARIITSYELGIGYNRSVFDICETPENDTLFTASEFLGNLQSPNRLFRRKNGILTDLSSQFPLLGDSLTFIETEEDGTTWICGRKGVLFQLRGESVRKISLPDSLRSVPISLLVIDKGNNKWIGLENRGLLKLTDIQLNPTLPASRHMCLGDSFAFNAGINTLGRGISKVQWIFSRFDTLYGESVLYAPSRYGKHPFSISIWDENGASITYSDSLTVDYPVSGLPKTSRFTTTVCGPTDIWTDSPFQTWWKLPNGAETNADTLSATELGIYTLWTQNGACVRSDSVFVVSKTLEDQKISIVYNSEPLNTDTLIATLPLGLSLFPVSSEPINCPPTWYRNDLIAGNGFSLEMPFAEEGRNEIRFESQLTSGCLVKGRRTLWIQELKLDIPNLLTLDGNGRNEHFAIERLERFPDNQLSLYNRWGKEIFSASPYQNNWPEKEIGEGTYFYSLKAGGKVYSGWILVVKGE